jgi:SAM-dependent methyltransferase
MNEHSLEELLDHIKIHFAYRGSNTIVYSPSPEKVPIIDTQLVEEICLHSDDESKDFFRSYMLSNYPRIFKDADIIYKFIPKESKILDIGSLPPLLPGMLKKEGYSDITVLDPNANLFDAYFKKLKVRFIAGDILELNNSTMNEEYDFVSICEVIEHLCGDMLHFLESISRLVKNDGYLLVTTPNLRSISGFFALGYFESGLASKYNDTVKMQYDRFQQSGYLGHVREYTEQEIKDLFAEFGFKHIRSFYQTDYRKQGNSLSNLIYVLENMFPEYRLFAKYIFKKSAE